MEEFEDQYSSDSLTCPYCMHENPVDDFFEGSGEDDPYDYKCRKCEKVFEALYTLDTTYISVPIEEEKD